VVCGRVVETDFPPGQVHAKCPGKAWFLGDEVERALESLGITKDRYVHFKEMLGMMPTCHCEDRKKFLNKISSEFGLSPNKIMGYWNWWISRPR
jgi:hypothetical protein